MLEQVGPQKLVEQLRAEAPRYAKLLPELPRLFYDYLKAGATHPRTDDQQYLRELLIEQRRTNKLLQALMYCGIGFLVGLIAVQIVLRVAIL
jgi:ubiquinone biosynthesis protein